LVSRRSGGILIAVAPCMQIQQIQPMPVAESLTQVLLLTHRLLRRIPSLVWVVYDNACGMKRFLRNQCRLHKRSSTAAWAAMQELKFVCDRVHYHGHKACKNPDSTYYEPSVDPYKYPDLVGVDTEAAEQVFNICDRWQHSLTFAAPVHQHMSLLLLASAWNSTTRCAAAFGRYQSSQESHLQKMAKNEGAPPAAKKHKEAVEDEFSCSPCFPSEDRNSRRINILSAACDIFPEADPEEPSRELSLAVAMKRQRTLRGLCKSSPVVYNNASQTVHAIKHHALSSTDCGWQFEHQGVTPVLLETLVATAACTMYSCGVCCGVRVPIHYAML